MSLLFVSFCCFYFLCFCFFFSSRRRHTRSTRDWSSDVCSSDLRDFPGPIGLRLESTGRIRNRVLRVVVRRLQILADVDLQRRPSVAEDVHRGAHARRDVVVTGDAVCSREEVRRAELIVQNDSVLAFREPAPCVLVSHAALKRQAATGPLILRVDGVEPRAIALPER